MQLGSVHSFACSGCSANFRIKPVSVDGLSTRGEIEERDWSMVRGQCLRQQLIN